MPTLTEIAELLGCSAPAGEPLNVTGIAALSEATSTELSYIGSDAFVRELTQCQAIKSLRPSKITTVKSEMPGGGRVDEFQIPQVFRRRWI